MAGVENFKKKAKDGDNDGFVQDGTPFERPIKLDGKDNKVAIHTNHNIFWDGIGRINRGYNIVSADAAELWLTKKGVRIATPEEVAKEYGL